MKTIKYIFASFLLLAGLAFVSCDSDNESFAYKSDLAGNIKIGRDLIETTKEGTNEGDYAPGSQTRLGTYVNWADFILTNSGTDTAYYNANVKLVEEIDVYKDNIVKRGYPVYVQGSFFNLGKLVDYDICDKFTIELKVRLSDLGTTLGNILSTEDGTGGIIIRYQEKVLHGYIHNGAWYGGSTREILDINKWYHVALVFTGTDLNLYVDGELELTKSGAPSVVKTSESAIIQIGTNARYAARFMKGNIIHLSIWDFPKTQAQIKEGLNANYAGNETGLLAYWPFNMNLGSTILDKSGKRTAAGTSINWMDPD